MSAKDDFLKIYHENIHRAGADELLAWLEKSDFFTAPASTKYHGAHEGGLCEHCLNVYNRLLKAIAGMDIASPQNTPISETMAICALLHDICKTAFYKTDYRNVKNEAGTWEKVPYYAVDDKLPYGHGEKSVYMISGFMRLSRDEAMAIRWHMGETDGNHGMSAQAFSKYPLALMLHIADMEATFLDEKEGK